MESTTPEANKRPAMDPHAKTFAKILFAGLLFGAGLAISGMTNPAKVIGFLNLAGGAWDPSLAFVMAGALLVFALGTRFLPQLPRGQSDPISKGLVIGAALFGIGWGLVGFCPGPALANLARLGQVNDSLWFVPAMAVGMILVQRCFDLDR